LIVVSLSLLAFLRWGGAKLAAIKYIYISV
jgi:hypothetical protein